MGYYDKRMNVNMKINKTVVVIGGVAGGMSFATRYRRLNINDHIIVFEKGPYVSFANCGLPYFMSGEIPSRTRLLVVKEKDLIIRFNLDIRSSTEVISINPERQIVIYQKDGQSYEQEYDELVLSPGAKPIVPTIKGLDLIPHFELRNIPNLDSIMTFIKDNNPKHVVILGAGYIGLEVAENLHKKGIKVSIVERAKEVLPIFDLDMASFARKELIKNGVDVFTDNEIIEVTTEHIILKDGTKLQAQFMITAIGVVPESSLAKAAKLKLGMRDGIVVDQHYQTSAKHIYAIGDAIVVKHQVSGLDALVPLASPANRQGRQLADILSGLPSSNKGSLGTAILRIFNLSLASTGLNERQLAGQHFEVIHVHGYDHVSYFPGATVIDLKVLFDPKTERILGVQGVGEKGVDKRIDVLSTAIKANMKITELQELELSYSPPYGSAKDLINMIGYIAQNRILGLTQVIRADQVDSYQAQGTIFVDVRSPMERLAYGHIANDVHMDIDVFYKQYSSLPKDKKIVVYCDVGSKGYNAERILRSQGYDVYNLEGGYAMYQAMKGT
jgi:NADPH-dependent 2,4-dienoyl-CoA reductase/sulfur reductase-like enzyme/rhodanese-related sulfurtransferase